MMGAAVATAPSFKKSREVPDALLQELRDHLTSRRVTQGMALLDRNAGLFTSLDPEQRNAATFVGYVAQWVDVGYRTPELVESLLARFPQAARSQLPVGDYLQLRMAEGALELAHDRPDAALLHFGFILSMKDEIADKILVALAHYWTARCRRRKGEYDEALKHTIVACGLAMEMALPRMAAVMHVLESWLHFQKGSRREAMDILEKAERVLESTDDYITMGNICSAYGRMIRRKGQYKEALDFYSRAIEHFKKRNPQHNHLARSLTNIAYVQRLLALQISRQIDSATARRLKRASGPLAGGARWQSQRDQCERYRKEAFDNLAQSENIYNHNQQRHGIGNVYENRGFLHLDMGELDKAFAEAEKVYQLGSDPKDFILMARARQLQCAIDLAKLEEEIEDDSHSWEVAQEAHDFARQAVEAARQTQNQRLQARAYVWAGLSAAHPLIDELPEARHYYDLTTSLLRAVDYEDQWDELRRLRELVESRGSAPIHAQLRAWSQGNTGGKSLKQMTEQFADIIVPIVWKNEKQKIARVATRLRMSPNKVRRILIRLGLTGKVSR